MHKHILESCAHFESLLDHDPPNVSLDHATTHRRLPRTGGLTPVLTFDVKWVPAYAELCGDSPEPFRWFLFHLYDWLDDPIGECSLIGRIADADGYPIVCVTKSIPEYAAAVIGLFRFFQCPPAMEKHVQDHLMQRMSYDRLDVPTLFTIVQLQRCPLRRTFFQTLIDYLDAFIDCASLVLEAPHRVCVDGGSPIWSTQDTLLKGGFALSLQVGDGGHMSPLSFGLRTLVPEYSGKVPLLFTHRTEASVSGGVLHFAFAREAEHLWYVMAHNKLQEQIMLVNDEVQLVVSLKVVDTLRGPTIVVTAILTGTEPIQEFILEGSIFTVEQLLHVPDPNRFFRITRRKKWHVEDTRAIRNMASLVSNEVYEDSMVETRHSIAMNREAIGLVDEEQRILLRGSVRFCSRKAWKRENSSSGDES